MPETNLFPTDRWHADMRAAIDAICDTGAGLLAHHRAASNAAETAVVKWRLEQRLRDEREALERILAHTEEIVESTQKLESALAHACQDGIDENATEAWEPVVSQHTALLNRLLPVIESSFSEVRHCALDLLRWTVRSGHIAASDWPARYRNSYAKLMAYAPDFDRLWQGLDTDVASLDQRTAGAPAVRQLVTALTHHRQLKVRIRGFLKSVIEPPFELIFEETENFIVDWEAFSPDEQATLATELNDCCQLLLYNQATFDDKVVTINPPLVDEMEAALLMLPIGDHRILFLADEDPVFEQTTITLLRAIDADQFDAAREEIVSSLFREFLRPESSSTDTD